MAGLVWFRAFEPCYELGLGEDPCPAADPQPGVRRRLHLLRRTLQPTTGKGTRTNKNNSS